jgi:putative transposase
MNRRKEIINEYKDHKSCGGVYTITNTLNGKYLIGYTAKLKSIQNRFQFAVATDSTVHPKLRKDWEELGAKTFTLEVLEELAQKPEQSPIWNCLLRNGMRSIPAKAGSWRAHWTRVIPLFAFSEDIRRIIYTTNAIESVNMTLRKVMRNHRIFPSDEAVYKVVAPFHAQSCRSAWTMPIHDWKPALNRFAFECAGRFPGV